MGKFRLFLTGFLCAALVIPSVNAGAVVINRHSMESEESGGGQEEKTEVDTKVETEKREEDVTIIDKETVDIIEPADIVFVIDSTGSMAPYIQNVADNVEAFSKYLESKGVDVRMAVVEYKDITCDGKDSTIVHAVDGNVWHKSTAELVKTLGIVKSGVTGGGDGPETVIDALGYLVDGTTFDFGREDSEFETHKFAIVLSDANFKENNNFGYNKASLIEKLKEQNINTSVITNT
ncbi:MAG: VWA domain-containing protein, partial [Lachnospiraceae bacterium]|nr:VWA domain-containing protein [Lachnospiraceae bacterium]